MTLHRGIGSRPQYPPPPPYPGGNNGAGNVVMNFASKQIMHRWIARKTGHLDKITWHHKGVGAGYAGGTVGSVRARTYHVNPDGTPDTSLTLNDETFATNSRSGTQTTLYTLHDFGVVRGDLYCTVFQNVDGSPATNFFSMNYPYYQTPGLQGSAARNEMVPGMPDEVYGLDSRECIGVSEDGGVNWIIPGETNPGFINKNLLAYAQQYDGGGNGTAISPSTFYSASQSAFAGLTKSMLWQGWTGLWQVSHIAVWLDAGTTTDGTVDILKDDVLVETIGGINGTAGRVVKPLSTPLDLEGIDGANNKLGLRALWRAPGGIYSSMPYSDNQMKTLCGFDTPNNKNMYWMDVVPGGYSGVTLPLVPLPGPPGFGFV